ncbi:DUF202 domain-containing protein [Nocardia sp. CA-290969]|uniref:DUF202 domain-containing protein n=1 Tax=Nocardia sp. CA-290969 TaxID=3239986 RepID=UPI003D8B716E
MTTDAGLQPERTALAWRRTLLAATVLFVLLIRSAVVTPSPRAFTGLCGAVVVLTALAATARLRRRRYLHDPADPRPIPVAAAAVVCAGICCTACGLLPPPA